MTSFNIAISDKALTLLQKKLELTVFPDELDDAGWQYGAPLADIQRLVSRWKDGYDWKKYEQKLNTELPQFTRDIEVDGHGSLNIHYVHKKSGVPGAIPLLFVHGWPGSFIEVHKILPLLTNPSSDGPVFDVVAPSLPGFGFSAAPKKKGFRLQHYAEVGHKLMLALGYNEYVTQGGDWGSLVTREIAKTYGGQHSKAWHTNIQTGSPPPASSTPEVYTAAEQAGLARTEWFSKLGRGYFGEQSTKPQTIGYSLADSPVGLLSWIYEKLVEWTDQYPWEDDEILDWISIYYFSRAGPAASTRIYYEIEQAGEFSISSGYPTIPLGFSYFPKELVVLPRSWTRVTGNLVFESEHDSGGHFAAHEKPVELVNDLRAMFGKGGACFGVVSGKNGYA